MIYCLTYAPEKNRIDDAKKQKKLSNLLLKHIIKTEKDIALIDDDILYNEHGKPFFKNVDFHFNLSNSSGLICCVLHNSEIGIDVENAAREVTEKSLRVCTEAERAELSQSKNWREDFIRLWTLKEAYMKYTGEGFSFGPKNIEFSLNPSSMEELTGVARYEMKSCIENTGVVVKQKKVEIENATYIISICSDIDFIVEHTVLTEADL